MLLLICLSLNAMVKELLNPTTTR